MAGTLIVDSIKSGLAVERPFKTRFTSSNQTITSGGALVLAHGLGAVPALVTVRLVCVTADAGYTAGQIVQTGFFTVNSAGNLGLSMIIDATNLTIRFGGAATVFIIPNAGAGVPTGLVNANWALVFDAWL